MITTLAQTQAEATLRPIIVSWIDHLAENGDGTLATTYSIVTDEQPQLSAALGRERVYELCRELHNCEHFDQSAQMTGRFNEFNKRFFRDALPLYRVRVVQDIFYWIHQETDLLLNLIELAKGRVNLIHDFEPYYYSPDDFQPSRIDLLGRQIVLPICRESEERHDCKLIHHMARAATRTLTDRDARWHPEMKRLRKMGAPVGDSYLAFELRTGEYVG